MAKNKKGKTVLIVDDDKFLLDMYALKFQEQGFDVKTAMGGREALDLLVDQKLNPDILLLDLVMPDVDGFEILKQSQEAGAVSNTTRIILSNLGQEEDIKKGLSLGAHGYIVKASATPSEVVEKVDAIIKAGKD